MEITGTWTLPKIASAVKNNLEAGLKTTTNYVFSLEQLENIIIAERNAIVQTLKAQGLMDEMQLTQEINCVELDCEDLALCCNANSGDNVKHFIVPMFSHLHFIGSDRAQGKIKTYYDDAFVFNKYKDSRLKHRPYILFRQKEGKMHGFYFNPPTAVTKYISISAIFENPIDVNNYDCCAYNKDVDRFPAPNYIIQQIIDGITQKWSSYMYRFQGSKPNTQSPII